MKNQSICSFFDKNDKEKGGSNNESSPHGILGNMFSRLVDLKPSSYYQLIDSNRKSLSPIPQNNRRFIIEQANIKNQLEGFYLRN